MTNDATGGAGILAGYISDADFCKELDIDGSTLRRWDRQGIAPPRTIIGRKRIRSLSGIAKWLVEREQASAKKAAAK